MMKINKPGQPTGHTIGRDTGKIMGGRPSLCAISCRSFLASSLQWGRYTYRWDSAGDMIFNPGCNAGHGTPQLCSVLTSLGAPLDAPPQYSHNKWSCTFCCDDCGVSWVSMCGREHFETRMQVASVIFGVGKIQGSQNCR